MKYGLPLVSTELSGKLGGIVGATARGGVGYFRRRVTGSNPNTPLQSSVRAVMALLSGNWKNVLTEPQRAGWTAKAGPTESGIDVYQKANFQQLISGAAASTPTAPATVALDNLPMDDQVPEYSIAAADGTIDVPAGTAIQWNMYISNPQSASRAARQFPFAYEITVPAGATSFDVNDWAVRTGATAGQVFYIRMVPFGSAAPKLGRVGQEQIFRCLVVP